MEGDQLTVGDAGPSTTSKAKESATGSSKTKIATSVSNSKKRTAYQESKSSTEKNEKLNVKNTSAKGKISATLSDASKTPEVTVVEGGETKKRKQNQKKTSESSKTVTDPTVTEKGIVEKEGKKRASPAKKGKATAEKGTKAPSSKAAVAGTKKAIKVASTTKVASTKKASTKKASTKVGTKASQGKNNKQTESAEVSKDSSKPLKTGSVASSQTAKIKMVSKSTTKKESTNESSVQNVAGNATTEGDASDLCAKESVPKKRKVNTSSKGATTKAPSIPTSCYQHLGEDTSKDYSIATRHKLTKQEWIYRSQVQGKQLDIKIEKTDDYCTYCLNGGDLMCCSSCPRAYHTKCLSIDDPKETKRLNSMSKDEAWHCDSCMKSHSEYCGFCGGLGNDDARLLPCSSCPRSFHWDCAQNKQFEYVKLSAQLPLSSSSSSSSQKKGTEIDGWICYRCEEAFSSHAPPSSLLNTQNGLDISLSKNEKTPLEKLAAQSEITAGSGDITDGTDDHRHNQLLQSLVKICEEFPPQHFASLLGDDVKSMIEKCAKLKHLEEQRNGQVDSAQGATIKTGTSKTSAVPRVSGLYGLHTVQDITNRLQFLEEVAKDEIEQEESKKNKKKECSLNSGSDGNEAAEYVYKSVCSASDWDQGRMYEDVDTTAKDMSDNQSSSSLSGGSRGGEVLLTRKKLLRSRCIVEETQAKVFSSNRKAQFMEKGLCVMPSALNQEQVSKTNETVLDYFNAVQHTLAQLDMTDDINEGFTTFKLRQPGRYDIVVPQFTPKPKQPKAKKVKENCPEVDISTKTTEDINDATATSATTTSVHETSSKNTKKQKLSKSSTYSSSSKMAGEKDGEEEEDFSFLNERAPWQPLVKQLLGDKASLIRIGCMLSLPGSDAQKWHSDGPHLHPTLQLPPHCLNVFIPLVDLDPMIGPTEFTPETQLSWDPRPNENVIITCKAGDAILFDYRMRHRGLGNKKHSSVSEGDGDGGPVPRPVIYVTYSSSKFLDDEYNFSKTRYKTLPPLVPIRKRD